MLRHAILILLAGALLSASAADAQRDRTRDRTRQRPSASADREVDPAASRDQIQANVPALSSQQQANLDRLQQDLETLATGAKNAEAEIRQLANDLQGMSIQAPDPALVEQLAADLQAAIADSNLSKAEIAQLTQDVNAVLNSADLSPQELEVLLDDVEAILSAAGVGRAEIEAVVRDLQAIYDEAQGNAGDAATRRRVRRPGR